MPWTIPNLLLHDKPVPLSNMRSHGRTHVFVYCSNRDCQHNAEIDASSFPDDVTFGDLQPRMLCSVCNHRGADVSPPILRKRLRYGLDASRRVGICRSFESCRM